MKITLNYIHPKIKKRCSRLELNSYIDHKHAHVEKLIDVLSQNITIISNHKDEHGDMYSHSIDEDYTICQKDNNKPSSIKVRIHTEKKERINSKKKDVNNEIKEIDLFGDTFDTEVRAMKRRKGDTILGLEDIE